MPKTTIIVWKIVAWRDWINLSKPSVRNHFRAGTEPKTYLPQLHLMAQEIIFQHPISFLDGHFNPIHTHVGLLDISVRSIVGRAIAQAVSRWLPIAAARAQNWV
jgi:hypothetical protein